MGKINDNAFRVEGLSATQQASKLKLLSRSSWERDSMVKKRSGLKLNGAFWGGGFVRLWQAVKRTEGRATTFLRRLVKLPLV